MDDQIFAANKAVDGLIGKAAHFSHQGRHGVTAFCNSIKQGLDDVDIVYANDKKIRNLFDSFDNNQLLVIARDIVSYKDSLFEDSRSSSFGKRYRNISKIENSLNRKVIGIDIDQPHSVLSSDWKTDYTVRYLEYKTSSQYDEPKEVADDVREFYEKKGENWYDDSVSFAELGKVLCDVYGFDYGGDAAPIMHDINAHVGGGEFPFHYRMNKETGKNEPYSVGEVRGRIPETTISKGNALLLTPNSVHEYLTNPAERIRNSNSFAETYKEKNQIKEDEIPTEEELLEIWIQNTHTRRCLVELNRDVNYKVGANEYFGTGALQVPKER